MLRLRVLASLSGLLLGLVAWGCSGADESDQPAAADQLFTSGFQIDSANFQQNVRPYVRIPKKNTCYGENLSPPLEWEEAPEATRSFAILAENLDHPTGRWVKWVIYNIPADVTTLPEGIPTSTAVLPDGTTQGTNDERQTGYQGICPPPKIRIYSAVVRGASPQRLEVTIYALDIELGLAPGATKADLLSAMQAHILAEARTMGKFQGPNLTEETVDVQATRTALAKHATPTPTP